MGEFKITSNVIKRTIALRMSGSFSVEEIKKLVTEYKAATDAHKGAKHLVFADLRGMKPMFPEVAQLFGECIQYGRARGTHRCAHLSDDTVTRLQTARLARNVTPGDQITIDVVSEAEANKVLDEERRALESLGAA